VSGFFVGVDKPVGITSHDVVMVVRRITQVKKVGHAGTLDPHASGVLVIAIGREATREIAKVVAKEKVYEAEILLGQVSDTDDVTGKVKQVEVVTVPSFSEVEQALGTFVGVIKQKPPVYSAVKIRGQEAYKRSRRGEVVEMIPKKVRVQMIELLSYQWPTLTCKITTGPGVYIRSIARDLGTVLGTGGCLSQLRRVRVGEWELGKCITLDKLEAWWESQSQTSSDDKSL